MDTLQIIILIGIGLDSLIGDPYFLPHPIRFYGNIIIYFNKIFNRGKNKKLKGAVTWLILCSCVFFFFTITNFYLAEFKYLFIIWNSLFFFYAISNRCLIEEGIKVERILQKGDIIGARKQLSMIVGRDTSSLSPSQIRSSVIETLSENLSDGVVAPLFFFALGGTPLMMTYKMINTLDSMVGYKNEKYRDFGFFSAKMDDVANFIPARITAFFMIIISISIKAIEHVFKYGRSHSSPNSGYPESALSGILDCRLGGPNTYFGELVNKPYIGNNPRDIIHSDVITTCYINAKVALLAIIILLFLQNNYLAL